MKKLLVVLIIVGMLIGTGGCVSHFTKEEKIWFGAMVGGQFADAHSTTKVLDAGGYEMNPIMGKDPSNDNVYLFKAGVVGLFYLLGEIFPGSRTDIFKFGTALGFGASAWNCSQF